MLSFRISFCASVIRCSATPLNSLNMLYVHLLAKDDTSGIGIFYIRNKFTYTSFYSSSVTLMHLHPSLQRPHHLGLLLLLQRVANVEQTTSSAVMVSATIVYLRLTAWSHSGQKYLRVYSLLWSCFPALHSATVSTDHRVVSVSSSSRSTHRWSSLAQTNATTNPALQCFGRHKRKPLLSNRSLYQFTHAACQC